MYARLGEITDKDVYGRRRGHCNVTAVLSCKKVLVLHYPLPELRQLRPRLRLLPLSAVPRRRRVRRWRLLQPGGAALRRPAGALPLLQLPAGAPRPRRLRPRPRPAPVGGRRRRQGEGQELRGQDRERHQPGSGAQAERLSWKKNPDPLFYAAFGSYLYQEKPSTIQLCTAPLYQVILPSCDLVLFFYLIVISFSIY